MSPSVTVEVQFGPTLAALVDLKRPHARDLRLCIEAALQGLLDDLGVPGRLRVVFGKSDGEPFRLAVCGIAAPYPSEMAQAVWDYLCGAPFGTSGPAFSLQQWIERSLPPEPDGWQRVVEFLSRLAVEIVKQRPERLLQSDQVPACLESDTAVPAVNPDEFLYIARQLLKLKLSIRNRGLILRHIREAAAAELGRDLIVEQLVNELRPSRIAIAMHPDGLRRLLSLELHDGESRAAIGAGFESFLDMFGLMSEGLFYELGIRVPPVEFRADQALNEDGFAIGLNHVPGIPRQGLGAGRLLVNDTPDRLKLVQIAGAPARNPANGNACAMVAEADGPAAEKIGLTTWAPLGYIVLSLAAEIRRGAARLLCSGMAEAELARLRKAFPALVWAAMDVISPAALTRILRGLLWEEVSIRDLRTILSRVAAYDTVAADTSHRIVFDDRLAIDTRLQSGSLREPDLYVEFVRQGMKNYLGHKHTRGTGNLLVYLLSPEVEEIVLQDVAARRGEPGAQRMTGEQAAEILSAISAEYFPARLEPLVILTFAAIRGAFRKLIEDRFPELGVLAYEELAADLKIQPIARISLPEKAPISLPASVAPSAG